MSNTTKAILVDGEPIGYMPATDAEDISYGSGSVADKLDSVDTTLNNMVFTEVTGITAGTGISNPSVLKATIGGHTFFKGSFRVTSAISSGAYVMSGLGVSGGGAGNCASPYSSGAVLTYLNGGVLTNGALAVSNNPYWFFIVI